MPEINNKAAMYERYLRGDFGNRLRTWDNLKDYFESGYDKPVVLRYKVAGSKWQKYGLQTPADVSQQVADWITDDDGYDPALTTLNELGADDKLILQGEAYRSPMGLYLRYSTIPKPMRLALKEEELHAHGLVAKILLQQFMYPSSYEWLMHLLDEYDGHVVEFSTFSCPVGESVVGPQDHNTVFWEVRNY
jgi:hypothetical protein